MANSSSSNFRTNGAASSSSNSSIRRSPFNQSESLPGLISHNHLEGDQNEDEDTPITVLLFGKSGDGKSTVGNMLLGGQVKGYFGTADCPSKRVSDSKRWEVIDTVGLFSPSNRISDTQLIHMLYDYLVTECPKTDVICYVKKASKYTGADEICLNHFRRLFKGHEFEQKVVLVFTFCPDQTSFLKFNHQLISKHTGVEYKRRVGVEFPPTNGSVEIEAMMKEKRSSSLKDLEKELQRAVYENVNPIILKPADRFSCYNTLNLFKKGEELNDYVRSTIDIDSPAFS